MSASREDIAGAARSLLRGAEDEAARNIGGVHGIRIVVVVTDEDGDFVGVCSNTTENDTHAILGCAARAANRVDHGAASFKGPSERL